MDGVIFSSHKKRSPTAGLLNPILKIIFSNPLGKNKKSLELSGPNNFPGPHILKGTVTLLNTKFDGTTKPQQSFPRLNLDLRLKMLQFEPIWIELILLKLKIKNWKYCNKIIFKCVNSIMRPIFNEKIVEKWNLWLHKQNTNALFIVKKSIFAVTVHETVHKQ